jgi:hypothetical protein
LRQPMACLRFICLLALRRDFPSRSSSAAFSRRLRVDWISQTRATRHLTRRPWKDLDRLASSVRTAILVLKTVGTVAEPLETARKPAQCRSAVPRRSANETRTQVSFVRNNVDVEVHGLAEVAPMTAFDGWAGPCPLSAQEPTSIRGLREANRNARPFPDPKAPRAPSSERCGNRISK